MGGTDYFEASRPGDGDGQGAAGRTRVAEAPVDLYVGAEQPADLDWYLDAEGRLLEPGAECEQTTGFAAAELQGRRVVDLPLLEPVDARLFAARLRRLRVAQRCRWRGRIRRRDGSRLALLWSARRGSDGSLRCVGIIDEACGRLAVRQARTEQYARQLLDLAFDLVVIHADDCILAMNESGARFLGARGAEDFIGQPFSQLFPAAGPWDGPIPEPGELNETRLRRGDGSLLEVEAAAIPIRLGVRPATQVVFRDISARKRAEAALRERERQVHALATVAPVGIFRTDPLGGFRYANGHWSQIAGLEESAALGQGWLTALAPEEREATAAAWQRALSEGRPLRRELRFVHRDGSVRWALLHATPERDEEGSLIGYVGSLTDVTPGKRAERELQRYREDLEGLVAERTHDLLMANRELESFSYTVSHDLRAPLRAINGFSNVLWEEYASELDPGARDYLERICSNTQRMARLIDGVLSLTRVSRQEMSNEPVDLSALAHGLVEELRAGDPGRCVSVRVADGLEAEGDPALVRLVLQNLLANAWKYTGRTGEALIEVGCLDGPGGEEPVFFVRDNGVGFDMAHSAQLFQAFSRLHNPSDFEGSGIGLATVSRIVRRHGGRIWAEGVPEQGATFYFTLSPLFRRPGVEPGAHG